MQILEIAKLYAIAVPVFFAIDLIWLGLIANNLYKRELGNLLAGNINWVAGITFYLIFIFGIIYFALLPALAEKNMLKAIINGALFGFFAYATYDLTNLATLKNWPFTLTLIDMVWGTVLSALVAGITFYIATKFLNF